MLSLSLKSADVFIHLEETSIEWLRPPCRGWSLGGSVSDFSPVCRVPRWFGVPVFFLLLSSHHLTCLDEDRRLNISHVWGTVDISVEYDPFLLIEMYLVFLMGGGLYLSTESTMVTSCNHTVQLHLFTFIKRRRSLNVCVFILQKSTFSVALKHLLV